MVCDWRPVFVQVKLLWNTGRLYLCILHELLVTWSAAQATQNNKTANIVRKECLFL